MNAFDIKLLSTHTKRTTVRVYEIEQPSAPSIIYFAIDDIANVDKCKAVRSDLVLGDPVLQATVDVPIQHLVFRTNYIEDVARIYAHYGLFRAGGCDFTAADCRASSDTAWMLQYEFDIIDLPELLADNADVFANYKLLQQLSYEIAEYDTDNRRTSLASKASTTAYDRLTVRLVLNKNLLTIACQDTAGRSAATHISSLTGIAEETIQCAAEIRMQALTSTGIELSTYNVLVAHADYSDSAIEACLPAVPSGTAIVAINVKYIIEVNTTGDVITVSSKLMLTDQQIANLQLIYGVDSGLQLDDLLNVIEAQQVQLRDYLTRTY